MGNACIDAKNRQGAFSATEKQAGRCALLKMPRRGNATLCFLGSNICTMYKILNKCTKFMIDSIFFFFFQKSNEILFETVNTYNRNVCILHLTKIYECIKKIMLFYV